MKPTETAIVGMIVIVMIVLAILAVSSIHGGSGGPAFNYQCPSNQFLYNATSYNHICAQVNISALGGSSSCQSGYYVVTIASTTGGTTGCAKFDYQCSSNQVFYNVTSSTYKCQNSVASLGQGSHTLAGVLAFGNSSTIGIDVQASSSTFVFKVLGISWALITSGFPSGCSAGQYVSAVGATLTCSTPSGTGVSATTCATLSAFTLATTTNLTCGADPIISSTTCGINSAVVQGATTTISCSALPSGIVVNKHNQISTTNAYISTTLTYSLLANENYSFTAQVFLSLATTASYNFQLKTMASGVAVATFCGMNAAVSVSTSDCVTSAGTPVFGTSVSGVVSTNVAITLFGTVTVGATPTTLEIDFANVANSGTNLVVVPGAFMTVYQS